MRALTLIFACLIALSQRCWSIDFQHEILPNVPGSGYTSYTLLGEQGQLMGTTNFGTRNRTFMLAGGEFRFFSYPESSVTFPVAMRDSNFFIGDYGPGADGFVYDHGVYSELRTYATNEYISPQGMSLNGNISGHINADPMYARINGVEYFPSFAPGYHFGGIYGINNNGLSFGYMEDGHSARQDFFWSPALGMNMLPFDWGFSDVNNQDELVGAGVIAGQYYATLFRNGQNEFLGSGGARHINDNSWILIQDNNQGFLWRHGIRTNMRELIDPTLDFDRIGFIDMNNRGQILAGLTKYTGPTSATYQTVLFTPVPEPGTWLTLGLAGICALRRRKLLASK